MKKKRHEAILELISHFDITTQDELLTRLQESGFDVTQATISRDIRELRLVKTVGENGQYKYAKPKQSAENRSHQISLLSNSIINVEFAGNMVVIKCSVGMANAACATLDSMHLDGVVGTLAGDDTIFIVCSTEANAGRLKTDLNNMVRTKE